MTKKPTHRRRPQAPEPEPRTTKKWNSVRAVLVSKGSAELLTLARDLFALSQENRDFVSARYLAGGDGLEPYKKAIDEAIYPDVYHNKPIRLAVAKKAVSQYTQATDDMAGTLELMVYFVERGNQFTVDFGDIDASFYSSLESMFGRVLDLLRRSEPELVERFLPRLVAIRDAASGIGWGYYDCLCEALGAAFPNGTEAPR